MKFKNKYKTFQYHTVSLKWQRFRKSPWKIATKLAGRFPNKVTLFLYGVLEPPNCKEFHIDNHYKIIDGEFQGQKFGDAIKKCTSLCMLYVEDNPDGTLKHIDFEIIK